MAYFGGFCGVDLSVGGFFFLVECVVSAEPDGTNKVLECVECFVNPMSTSLVVHFFVIQLVD